VAVENKKTLSLLLVVGFIIDLNYDHIPIRYSYITMTSVDDYFSPPIFVMTATHKMILDTIHGRRVASGSGTRPWID
jgi:hypothetical protein